MGAFVYLLRFA